MSRWFRHYAGMMRDDKLVRAAVKAKQPVERVVWVWGAVLESAAEINDAGRYEFDVGEAAYFLRCDEPELVRIVECLEDIGRLHEGVVARWSDRQFDSDSAKERQRRYRERRKAGSDVHDVGETSQSVTRDGAVTSRDGMVTLQETETDTDTDISEPSGSGAASPADPRQQLWSEGVSTIKAMTGKTDGAARQIVGRWCKLTQDDCALILSKIRTAQAERVGDPVSWVTAALMPRATAPPKKVTHANMWTEEAKAFGLIDEPDFPANRRLEGGLSGGQDQGFDLARRIASS